MLTEDFRHRVRMGDLAALADPALPLHLLADGPGAEWWQEGRKQAAVTVRNRLLECLSGSQAASALLAWAAAWGLRLAVEQVALVDRSPKADAGPFVESLRWCTRDLTVTNRLDLARRLRALLPSAPPEIDAALAVLERYAP